MKIERWFPSPDLAAAFIQGVELFDNVLGGFRKVKTVELYFQKAQAFGPYEAWVVILEVGPCGVNITPTNLDIFDRKGWTRQTFKKSLTMKDCGSWLAYVRKYTRED